MGRLRGDICRCLEPRPEAVKARSGRVLGHRCKKCLGLVTDWRPKVHRAFVEERPGGELVGMCLSSGADSVELAEGLFGLGLPGAANEPAAVLLNLDEVCHGRHVLSQGRRGRPTGAA